MTKNRCYNQNSKGYNCKVQQVICSNGGFDNWTAEIVQTYIDCKSIDDARIKRVITQNSSMQT